MPRTILSTDAELDRLRAHVRTLVEKDGRSMAAIGAAVVPPISRSHVHSILSGPHYPSVESLLRLLAALDPPQRVAIVRA